MNRDKARAEVPSGPARARMSSYTGLFCVLALFCTLFLGSRAPILQIFISVMTQCLLNRNIPCFPPSKVHA